MIEFLIPFLKWQSLIYDDDALLMHNLQIANKWFFKWKEVFLYFQFFWRLECALLYKVWEVLDQ